MTKKAATSKIGTTTADADKDFAGNGVEGQKGAAAEVIDPDTTLESTDSSIIDINIDDAADPVDPPAEKTIFTGEDVLKNMRAKREQI